MPIPEFTSNWSDQMFKFLKTEYHHKTEKEFEEYLLSATEAICISWGDKDKTHALKNLFERLHKDGFISRLYLAECRIKVRKWSNWFKQLEQLQEEW